MSIVAVDLFCGAGGLTHGLERAGVEVRAGIDIDADAHYAYEANNKARFIEADVGKVKPSTVSEALDGAEWSCIVGCAPCQPFSTYRQGHAHDHDDRWGLLAAFGKLVSKVRPDLVSMENVPSLRRHSIFSRFVKTLESNGYTVWYDVVQSADYGVPQQRQRLILLASRHGDIELIAPTHRKYKTVRQAIGSLPRITAGSSHERDPMHKSSKLSKLNLQRIKASSPGGTWRDWPEELVADCHKRGHGTKYPAVYGRMEWDKPAPTITTECFGFGSGRFGHPEQDRGMSLREAALLQSFPPSYKFFPADQAVGMKAAGKLIGNAVPVRLGWTIGKSLLAHIESIV